MAMFKKNQKVEESNTEVKSGMTYTELVSQEHDQIINGFLKNRKRLKDGINQALEALKGKGSHNGLVEMVVKLREEEVINEKELWQVELKHAVDPELKDMARILDEADGTNKGMDLLYAIGPKINAILSTLPEIEGCYGLQYNRPFPLVAIRKGLEGLAVVMNSEMPKLHKVDKEALKQKIKDKMEILRVSKMESQAITDKYKNL